MTAYQSMTAPERAAEYEWVRAAYLEKKARGLRLDMSRGKPGAEQLDLVGGLFDALKADDDFLDGGIDVRNYGAFDGIPSAKRFFAELIPCRESQVLVGGNSSLLLMYNVISMAFIHGLLRSEKPWSKLDEVKFLCPVPGYDRHFKVTESFGFTLVPIPLHEDGPDMDAVEAAIQDPAVKGMWCVPKYSNPTGIIYSDAVIARIAAMKPAAADFALMWDNAYCVHGFDGVYRPIPDILALAEEAGRPDMVYAFTSTSKITFSGAGISAMASSEANLKYLMGRMSVQTIGFDKVNQLRHVRYLRDLPHVMELMGRHGALIKPKFDAVLDRLDREIAPLGIASWTRPAGGYFISLDTLPGCAARTLELCREAGLTMTGAGAAFPYGKDPKDTNIRIAPSYPSVEELREAGELFCLALRMATLEAIDRSNIPVEDVTPADLPYGSLYQRYPMAAREQGEAASPDGPDHWDHTSLVLPQQGFGSVPRA